MVKTLKNRKNDKKVKNKKNSLKKIKKINTFKQYEKVGSEIITRKAFLKFKLDRFKKLSPFELKNTLIYLAKTKNPLDDFTMFLNAGRGNPNFYNSFVRQCYTQLQAACLQLSSDLQPIPNVDKIIGLKVYPLPSKMNFHTGMMKHLKKMSNKKEYKFIGDYLNYLSNEAKKMKLNVNHIMHDVVLSMIGCFYPSPPRIQPHLNLVVKNFMHDLIFGNKKTKEKPDDYEYFATEGAAAGILYVFNTLHINGLLKHGDTIALITPIFSPYLEMPILKRYKLKILQMQGDPNDEWSLDDSEIEKLKDKKIKGLFMVNPANTGAFSLPLRNIQKIGEIVNSVRKDLIILSDNVYAPFTKEYNSLAYSCPQNTIEVFSLSKYFGTTGWRLGVCMVRKENRFNTLLKNLPKNFKKQLKTRYSTSSVIPEKLTFMQRLVDDSRQVAEAHVGGLSTPQQAIIGMFLFYDIHDKEKVYRDEIHSLLKYRMGLLYSDLNTPIIMSDRSTNYYNLLNIPEITENLYGKEARAKIEKTNYLHFLFHLAKKYKTVLLPGIGFGAPKWYLRISLANLASTDYKLISKNIKLCIFDFIKKSKRLM